MTAYYNELDPYVAQWLRNLIEAGHIAFGVVDERSIEDVRPDELAGYTQCHFFAGIGVWSYALRLAGWPDDRPVWTGSCPCQPFSAAGKGAGFDDERHLWPAWNHLISECRPAVILGEQVASKDIDPWIDLVQADVEAMGYALGCVPFPSAGVGAPHIRDRAYFVAHTPSKRRYGRAGAAERSTGARGVAGVLADSDRGQFDGLAVIRGIERDGKDGRRPQGLGESESRGDVCELADSADIRFDGRRASEASDGRNAARLESERLRAVGELADTDSAGKHALLRSESEYSTEDIRCGETLRPFGYLAGRASQYGRFRESDPQQPRPTNGFWRDADWLSCRDGKWRPVEPGTFPLVDGAPSRVGRLRAYGNAINAEAAKVFIESVMDILCEA